MLFSNFALPLGLQSEFQNKKNHTYNKLINSTYINELNHLTLPIQNFNDRIISAINSLNY